MNKDKLWFLTVALCLLAVAGALLGLGYSAGRKDTLEQFATKAMEECACVCKWADQ